MKLNAIELLGESNPQLFRELIGRLQPRNILITLAFSGLSQFILLFMCYENLSSNPLDWQFKWSILFRELNWILPLVLLIGGVYLIVSDLSKEENSGTLNFIRLSPQSSQSILTGKLLGVPALLYLGIGLAVPLHWVSALAANVPLIWVAGIYTLWGAGCYLFYSAALLLALLNVPQQGVQSIAWTSSFLALVCGLSYVSLITLSFDFYQLSHQVMNWQWFLLPTGTQPLLAGGLVLTTLSVATYWIWQAVNRRFRNPNTTLLSKGQSYWLVASFQLWVLGFVLPGLNPGSPDYLLGIGLGFVFFFNPLCFFVLIAVLSPGRQALQDWARYREVNRKKIQTKSSSLLPFKFYTLPSSVHDLIRGEKSPALLAIAINLVITAVIWVPWILLWPQEAWAQEIKTPSALLGLLLHMNVILIFAGIVQLITFAKTHQRVPYAVITLGLILLPPFIISHLPFTPEKNPGLWLFSAFPLLALPKASATTIFLGLLGQWGILGLLIWQLTRQLRLAGKSASKELLP